jgi:hypothetical protein
MTFITQQGCYTHGWPVGQTMSSAWCCLHVAPPAHRLWKGSKPITIFLFVTPFLLPEAKTQSTSLPPSILWWAAGRVRSPRALPHPCAPVGPGFEAQGASPWALAQILPLSLPHAGELLCPCASLPGASSNHCLTLLRPPCSRRAFLSRRRAPQMPLDLGELPRFPVEPPLPGHPF